MAHQPDKDSDSDGQPERDERPMLDLAGQPPQCLVSEPCRVAAEMGRLLAEGVGAATEARRDAAQRRSDGSPMLSCSTASSRLPTRFTRSSMRRRPVMSPVGDDDARIVGSSEHRDLCCVRYESELVVGAVTASSAVPSRLMFGSLTGSN
jgi:hypothetical protein